MATIVPYENLYIVSPTPSATGGLALNNNFIAIADELATLAPINNPSFTGTFNADSSAISTDGNGNISAQSLTAPTLNVGAGGTQLDAGQIYTSGAGNLFVQTLTNIGQFSSDGNFITTDGNGDLFLSEVANNDGQWSISSEGVIVFDNASITSNGSGTLTATSFIGDGSGLTGVITVGSEMNFDSGSITSNGSGTLTATSFIGDGSGLTGLNFASIGDPVSEFINDAGYIPSGSSMYFDGGAIISDGGGDIFADTLTATNGAVTALSINTDSGSIQSDGGGKLSIQNLNIASLPTSTDGLNSGDIWNNSGVLNIV